MVGGTKTAEEHKQHSTVTVSSQDEFIVDNENDPDEEIKETVMDCDFVIYEESDLK